jgi:hypothetical protein
MNKKLTLSEYNYTLKQMDLICISDEIYISKRKNYTHSCKICNKVFTTTAGKLLKNCECPNLNNHIPLINVENYASFLPSRKKLKHNVIDMDTNVKHLCLLCAHIFKISPNNFIKQNYKCVKCKK